MLHVTFFLSLLTMLVSYSAADHIRGISTTRGLQRKPDDEEIRNGDEYGDWPFFVRLESDVDSDYVCGGTMIHEDIVLTAASCVDSVNDPGIPSKVLVGPNADAAPPTNGTEFSINGAVLHPSWMGDASDDFNLAILRLSTSIANPADVVPVNNDSTIPNDGALMNILGFGLLDNTTYPSQLLGGFVEYLDDCGQVITSYNATTTICALPDLVTGQISCPGDAGGPVLEPGSNVLLGVQFGADSSSCNARQINAYSRLSSSYDWIQEQICELSVNPPTGCPSRAPSSVPSGAPSTVPSSAPSAAPSAAPTVEPDQPCIVINCLNRIRDAANNLYRRFVD